MPYLQRSGGEKRKKKSQEKKSISIKNASYTKCTINVQYRKTEKICTTSFRVLARIKTYFWASEQAFEEKTSFEGDSNENETEKNYYKENEQQPPERGPLGSAIRYCKTSSSQSTKNLSIYFPSENQQQYLALDLLYIP
ncbi:unnamed protein product [Rhizophagus irregularis]|nr:unnamed protein product [Rhizophagus irregularis]